MLKKVRKFIRSKDIIAPSGSSQLHIRSDIDQKNLIGGIFPISIRLYVLLVALALGKQMLLNENPKLLTIDMTTEANQPVYASKLPMIFASMYEKRYQGIDLIKVDYRKYISIRVANILKKFDENKKMKEDKEYYELEVCTEKSFTNDNDHKKAYWDIWMKGEGENSFLCFKKEDLDKIVMQGTYESRFLKKDHSYWVYEIDRCTDFEGKELLDYPPCASNQEIEKFLEDVNFQTQILNEQIDYSSKNSFKLRYSNFFTLPIKLQSGKLRDQGYRFRQNTFERRDIWWSYKKYTHLFNSVVFYNDNELNVNETRLGQVYFRFDTEKVEHSRFCFSFMEFIGGIGGVKDILIALISFFYGGYAESQGLYSTTQHLYKVESPKKIFNDSKKSTDNLQLIKLSYWQKIQIFFKCAKTKRMKQVESIYQRCSELAIEDLDIVNLIERIRRCTHDIQCLKDQVSLPQSYGVYQVFPRQADSTFIETEGTMITKVQNTEIIDDD